MADKCPKCNETVQEKDAFCNVCGAELRKVRSCPTCHAIVELSWNFCSACGAMLGKAEPLLKISGEDYK